MHKITFRVGPEPKNTERSATWALKFKVEYQSDLFKAFVQRYFENKNDTTHIILARSLFTEKILITQVLEIQDHKSRLQRAVVNTKENRRKLGGHSSAPFLYLKEDSYFPLSLLGENIIPLKSGQSGQSFIEEIGSVIGNMLSPLHDYFIMQSTLQSILK